MKYNYDKKVLKGLGVGPFLNITKDRNSVIEKADGETIPSSIFNVNKLSAALHPSVQYARVEKIEEREGAKSYTLVADKSKGTENLAFFRAGQYVTVSLAIDGSFVNRPYTIGSGPRKALEKNEYVLTIKTTPNGFASSWILENWKVGDSVVLSGPQGDFYYTHLRDEKTVIALAGGSGITPFISMAESIVSGDEDFNLIILYGSRTEKQILLKEELEALEKEGKGKIKVVFVLSDEEKDGYEHGFLSSELIKKYAPSSNYSVFMCGPKKMYEYEDGEIEKLGLRKRLVRKELSGEYGKPFSASSYPSTKDEEEYKLTVVIRGEEKVIKCKKSETLLVAMEREGIKAPSRCRSGECGWCHSLLVEGEVFIPEETDGRRGADKKFNWIHPCCSFPLSDVKLEVPVK